VTLRVEEQVGWLQVSVEQVSGVHILEAFQALVNNVLLVDILKDICSDNGMEICVHKVEDQVDIAVILSPHYVLETNDIFVSGQLLQENNLSERSLSVSSVLKGVKILFKRYDFLSALVNRFPHNTVSTLA
jgi:hypothetical protein